MRAFLETTFGPADFEVLDTVLEEWRTKHGMEKNNPDVGIAAAVMINLFREGNDTVETLRQAVSQHKALAEFS
ncbi:hypothetical protein [Neorhizobium alkalisoli]|uniref:Uncharacterized protein n=1 Tax=Neorhizobium alkalisoli TaxID=528178 RepID=A0A561R7I4_9HYPH|nr:hypothetical protein [Neorhizobium alkalisoli]TWF58570.1 hypothetical protein FHW37_101374 [Neorhizobium alkalisoli]